MKSLVFSCGDINGIGPEIIVRTLSRLENKIKVIIPVPLEIFQSALEITGLSLEYKVVSAAGDSSSPIEIIDIATENFNPGEATATSGEISYKSITLAYDLVTHNKADAIVTAPISKKALGLANIDFPGHTEMFQSWTNAKYPLMTFLSDDLKCALVTIHEPLKNIAKLITIDKLRYIISSFSQSLKLDFGITAPEIAVLGLNPHAGEKGRIGTEELETIIPVLNEFSSDGISGPYVPDAFFGNKTYKQFDAYIAMYHDQGLIPFKLMNFDRGVNYTAGLPLVRTSPDHGTAFDIAWKGKAKEESFYEAVKWAVIIHDNRLRHGKNS